MELIHPLLIISSRYGGIYEGAAYLAFNEFYEDPELREVQSFDDACVNFFHNYKKPIGRGATPCEAYHDLQRQMEKQGKKLRKNAIN